MKRIDFIDQLKAASIFLIVYGHNDYVTDFSTFLTSFRLPLFFIISGFVRKEKSSVKFNSFIKKITRRLIIPYFLLSSFLYLLWFFVGRHYGKGVEYSVVKNFIGIFYSQGGSEYMDWGIPMWFLTALFCVSLIDFFLSKTDLKLQIPLIIVLAIIGYIIYPVLRFHLFWSLDVALVVFPFYYFGGILRKLQNGELLTWLEKQSTIKKLGALLLIFGLHLIGAQLNEPVLFYSGSYGCLPLMYLNGILGFAWMFLLFNMLPTHRFVTWIGRNTLPILALHLTGMSFIKAVFIFGFGQEPPFGIAYNTLYTILQIFLLVPVIIFLNKYLPFVVGVQSEKYSTEQRD